MAPSNKDSRLFTYVFHRKKGEKKFFVFLILFGVCVVFSFFIVVLFFTLFSGFLTTSSSKLELEQVEVATTFPEEGTPYLFIYKEAGKKYGVPWNILAAIHKVETDFGRDLSVSVAGAKGHTQFMDKSWIGWRYPGGTKWGDLQGSVDITDPTIISTYGGYGVDADGDGKADPYSPIDAIHSTANFLSKVHRTGEDWFSRGGAIWQYNHDYENYVRKVQNYAEAYGQPSLNDVPKSFMFPVSQGVITSPFGERFHPIRKVWINHRGIDIGKEAGAPIYAAQSGQVIESRASIGYGWKITLYHGDGVETVYAHMEEKDVNVTAGQRIQLGQIIAYVGSNGWSTGPHLHFEVHKNGKSVDPELFFTK